MRCAGEVLGDRVASSKLPMPEARALNAKLIKRQYFGMLFRLLFLYRLSARLAGRMPSRLEPF
jgi:hypothetical protein